MDNAVGPNEAVSFTYKVQVYDSEIIAMISNSQIVVDNITYALRTPVETSQLNYITLFVAQEDIVDIMPGLLVKNLVPKFALAHYWRNLVFKRVSYVSKKENNICGHITTHPESIPMLRCKKLSTHTQKEIGQ